MSQAGSKDESEAARSMRQPTYRYRQDLEWSEPTHVSLGTIAFDQAPAQSDQPPVDERPARSEPTEDASTDAEPDEADARAEAEAEPEAEADAQPDDAPPEDAEKVEAPGLAALKAKLVATPPRPKNAEPQRGAMLSSASMSAARQHQVVEADRELERQEHLATVGRMRRLMPLAVVLWLGFFFVDWVLATWVVPGPLLPYLGLRLLGVLPILASWWRLSHGPIPSPRLLAGLDLAMTSSSATILSAMCLLSGGLTSPYATYIAMVIAGRAASTPDHWRTGMVRLGVPALASPVVLALALPLSPALQLQLADAGARGTYFFYLMLIGGAWGLLVIASHNAWTLRRQVFRTRSIGRYRLERRIGEGGMGEVWVAWDEQLRRDVALKILRPEAGTQADAVARFEREIMATAALSHPNTVRIYDHGSTDDGLWYYAMELLSGVDLYDMVATDGPLSPARAVHVGRQAAGALAEAHRRGIVHRDLKPENIFVAELGGEPDFVKVLDFGIVRMTQSDEPRLTGTGWVAGTPAYVSPEVAAGGDAGPAADVYGLGGVLYFAVTGTSPFDSTNSAQLLQLAVTTTPDAPSARLGRPVSPRLEATIMKCLAKRPADRFADAGELARALDRCAIEEGGSREPEPDPTPPASARRAGAAAGAKRRTAVRIPD
ncbi:serine/threonine-protein kinase [Paraliomyxa miuraensis]|uniref:serine/threonine-protein kinase n=1 Tax=Paraliomyxa miuraensis TaxID=376150 RepID=UPI00225BC6C5|nr:serine/threonine-protein kinase [Paraliomyxa miuraensis]MCX4246819.1 serine/threonine protein kinase [Paraliomyxa miuraensis]